MPVNTKDRRPQADKMPAAADELGTSSSEQLSQPVNAMGVASANRWKRRWSLIASDIVAMTIATVFALILGDSTRAALLISTEHYGIPQSQPVQIVMMALPILLLVWSSYLMGHYTRLKPLWNELKDFLGIIGYTVAVIAIVLFFTDTHFSRIWFWFPSAAI